MAFPTVATLDDFNRADGAVGANWVAGFGDPVGSISSNTLRGSAAGWRGMVWAPSGTPAGFGAPQEARYTIPAVDLTSSQMAGIMARGTGLTTGSYTGYIARINGSNQLQIGKYVSGSFSVLNSGSSTLVPAVGDKLGIEVIGTGATVTINLYWAPAGVWPGSPTLTASDSSAPITTGGQVGLSWHQSGANTTGVEDFGAGTTSSGTPSGSAASHTGAASSASGARRASRAAVSTTGASSSASGVARSPHTIVSTTGASSSASGRRRGVAAHEDLTIPPFTVTVPGAVSTTGAKAAAAGVAAGGVEQHAGSASSSTGARSVASGRRTGRGVASSVTGARSSASGSAPSGAPAGAAASHTGAQSSASGRRRSAGVCTSTTGAGSAVTWRRTSAGAAFSTAGARSAAAGEVPATAAPGLRAIGGRILRGVPGRIG